MAIKPETVKQALAALRGYPISPIRAEQLAREVARVNDAARAAAIRNDFNAQPSDFAVALSKLARK